VFENRVLKRKCQSKRDDATGEWRKLYNKELNNLYYSTNIVRVIKSRIMRWVGPAVRMGRVGAYKGEHEGKRPIGRPRHRREDNIKMYLQKKDVGIWTGSSWLRIGTVGGHL
jgi:hypothetical protein